MQRSSFEILEGKMRDSIAEGLVVKYQATDEDLPSIFWPDLEEKFWSELERKLDACL